MNKASERQARYDEKSTRRFGLKLNTGTDKDIIERLEKATSMQGYIWELITRDAEMDKGIFQRYALLTVSCDKMMDAIERGVDAGCEKVIDSMSAGLILQKLEELKASDDKYCIETYRADNDGEFYDGSDFDTPSNFTKRMAFHMG